MHLLANAFASSSVVRTTRRMRVTSPVCVIVVIVAADVLLIAIYALNYR